MGRDLDDGIDGRVDDRLARPQMLGAEFLNDRDTVRMLVAKDARDSSFPDQRAREVRPERRECA